MLQRMLIALICGIAICGLSASTQAGTVAAVDGTVIAFQDTGVDVAAGETVTIAASGRIVFGSGGRWTDPNGYGNSENGTAIYTGPLGASAIFGSMLGRVGASTLVPQGTSPYIANPGTGFVGACYSQAMPTAGRLYLAYNDGNGTDNSGTFKAIIQPDFIVDGTVGGWQDTGIDVTAGQGLKIDAAGQVKYSTSVGGYTDPDGLGPYQDGTVKFNNPSVPANGAIEVSLVGQVGSTLVPEGWSPHTSSTGAGFVGGKYRRVIPNSGRLYLAYNDGGVADNAGFHGANIEVVDLANPDAVGFWRFSEQAPGGTASVGDPVRDSSGWGNDGTVQGSPLEYVAGGPLPYPAGSPDHYDGIGMRFESNSDGAVIPASPLLAFEDSFTFEAMIKTTQNGSGALVGNTDSSTGQEYWVRTSSISGSSYGLEVLARDGVSPTGYLKGDVRVNDGQWHHVAMVYDRAQGEFRLFVDYELDEVQTGLNITGTIGSPTIDVLVGKMWNGAEFAGDMEFMRMSAAALDPSQFVQPIPEPASFVLAALGLIGLAMFARRRVRS